MFGVNLQRSVAVVLLLGLLLAPCLSQELPQGSTLPDCSKIPLVSINGQYRPEVYGTRSVEDLLLPDGVVILHFASPRPPRKEGFKTYFVEEVSALAKAAMSVPYPCIPIVVVPFGDNGRQDTSTLIAATEARPWGETNIYYEPTFPRPGLYRTFHPGAAGNDIVVPWTYLIGPGRKVLAVRQPGNPLNLYDWLQQNLPANVTAAPKTPSTDLSLPSADLQTWPAFRRTLQHQAEAMPVPNTLPYTYLAWKTRVGKTFASPAVVDGVVYIATDTDGLRTLTLDAGKSLQNFPTGQAWWTSPAVAKDNVYTINADGIIHALDRGKLQPQWKRKLGGLITSSPVVSEGSLYVGARNGAVYKLDAATGEVLWTFQTGGEISSSPALAQGLVIIGSGDRNLYAIRGQTGEQAWSVATAGAVDSSPTVEGSDVLVGSFDGSLYSVHVADGNVNWRCELGGWVHSSPAVSGNTV